jgi:hypothetical protein
MKMVKSLLLGSAASIVAVAGTQAADLPVKAKPVEYVKICSLYGDGFFYVPGTETCVRIGASAQMDIFANAAGGQAPLYFANGAGGFGGAQDRTTSAFAYRARGDAGFDARTQTSYGTLRSMVTLRIDNLDQGAVNPALVRSFIQWSGFTFGRTRSYTDPIGMAGAGPGFNMLTQWQIQSDTGGGVNQFSYSYEIGNGMVLIAGVDERRVKPVVNLNQSFPNLAANAEPPTVGVGTSPNSSRAGENIPNPWLAFRVSQDWGSASAAVVGNLNQGTYYGGVANIANGGAGGAGGAANVSQAFLETPGAMQPACAGGGANNAAINAAIAANNPAILGQQTVGGNVTIGGTDLCGHPKDKWGVAFVGGIEFKLATFLPSIAAAGDRIGGYVTYGVGASAYGGGNNLTSPALFSSGNRVALGVTSDAVYCTPQSQGNGNLLINAASCTGNLEQTTSWAFGVGYEHYWMPNLSTKIYGGYGEQLYNNAVKNGGWLCGNTGSGVVQGTGATTNNQPNALTGGILIPGGTGRCNPSFNMTMVAAQINWFPVPGFRMAFEVAYTGIGTAFAGQQVLLLRSANGVLGVEGARHSGLYTATDQSIVSAAVRVQRGFGGVGE